MTELAGFGVRNDGQGTHFFSNDTQLRVFFDPVGQISAVVTDNEDGIRRWVLLDVNGIPLPVSLHAPVMHLQDPFLQGPVAPGVFAVCRDHMLIVSLLAGREETTRLPIDMGFRSPSAAATDVAATPRCVAVRIVNDPAPGHSCVCVAVLKTQAVTYTKSVTMRPRLNHRYHALTPDGRYLLVTEGQLGHCYRVDADGLLECWTVKFKQAIKHAVPCGPDHFAMRVGDDRILVVSAATGEICYTRIDHGIFGRRFVTSPDGNQLACENLVVVEGWRQ